MSRTKKKERGLSRADSRYTVFWLRHDPSSLRCGFPSLDQAQAQAQKYAHLKPMSIIDLVTHETVWDYEARSAPVKPSHRVGGN